MAGELPDNETLNRLFYGENVEATIELTDGKSIKVTGEVVGARQADGGGVLIEAFFVVEEEDVPEM